MLGRKDEKNVTNCIIIISSNTTSMESYQWISYTPPTYFGQLHCIDVNVIMAEYTRSHTLIFTATHSTERYTTQIGLNHLAVLRLKFGCWNVFAKMVQWAPFNALCRSYSRNMKLRHIYNILYHCALQLMMMRLYNDDDDGCDFDCSCMRCLLMMMAMMMIQF